MGRHRKNVVVARARPPGAKVPSQAVLETGNVVRLEHETPPATSNSLSRAISRQWKRLAMGGLAAVLCSVSNVAAPVFMGVLFEFLVVGSPVRQYMSVLAVFCLAYIVEPILSSFYMRSVITAGETVLSELRREVFDRLLHEEVSFFDRHRTAEFTNFLAVELDTLRHFVFANVTRDRGLRSILEVAGVIIVLFWMSWRLAPVLCGKLLMILDDGLDRTQLCRCDFGDGCFGIVVQTLHQVCGGCSVPGVS